MMEHKATPLTLKADQDGTVEGYASRFNEIDRGGDTVRSGAYAGTLSTGRAIKMLWQHDPSQPIGVWSDLKEDETGLHVKGRILSDVEKGREALALIRAGAVDGLSIGYRTVDSERGDKGERILKELDLWEVSLVTFPMQETALIDAVKASQMTKIELERRLTHDARLTRSVARALMGGGLNAVKAMHDAGGDGLAELRDLMGTRFT